VILRVSIIKVVLLLYSNLCGGSLRPASWRLSPAPLIQVRGGLLRLYKRAASMLLKPVEKEPPKLLAITAPPLKMIAALAAFSS